MRLNVKSASVVAATATMVAAAMGVQGSGVMAQNHTPQLMPTAIQAQILPAQVMPGLPNGQQAAAFVSIPLIQQIPSAITAGIAAPSAQPSSLSQLVAQQAQPEALSDQMHCLAGAIYFEAKGETLAGQLAVARVVISRAASGRFPSSYCGVVYQPSQFSFVRGRAMPAIRKASAQWRQAVAIAQIADHGDWQSPTEGALFFHAKRVSPRWRLTRIAQVDDHVFYR